MSGITIDSIDQEAAATLSAANGSSLNMIGSINLHWKFNGRSVGCTQSGEPDMSGPTMDFWYPTCAAVFNDLSTPFIMSASLLRTHSMQISYADSPGPTVTLEQGKRFPFLNHVQVGNEKGKMLYPKGELFGDFLPPQPIATNDCQNLLLQAGDQGPDYSGTTLDQG